MKKGRLLLIFLLALQPLFGYSQAPEVVLPSRGPVSITQQHLYYPNNFIYVHSATVDGVLYATYSYNISTVKNDLAEATITCWLLEEWTEAGRAWLLKHYRSMGYNTDGMEKMHYLYYPICFLYDDPFSIDPYYAWQYEYIIKEGGEVCDHDKKYITYVSSTSRYARIDEATQLPFLRLAEALKAKYNL